MTESHDSQEWHSWTNQYRPHDVHGQLLTTSDRDRIKVLVQEFASRGLAAFVERQMRLLNEQVGGD